MKVTAVAARLDSHNPSVDAAVAQSGHCGALHLPSGRRCALLARHSGSCAFVRPQTRAVPRTAGQAVSPRSGAGSAASSACEPDDITKE
jgi:hypothetical protein